MSTVRDISEQPSPVRSRSLCYYVVLFVIVLPFWSLVPIMWFFALYSLYTGNYWSYGPRKLALFFVACSEAVFSIYCLYLMRRVAGRSPIGPRHADELQVAFTRMLKAGLANLPEDGGDIETLDTVRPGSPAESVEQLERYDPRAIDFRNSIRTWFCKVPWSSIKLVEMRTWLYWAMYSTNLPTCGEIPEAQKLALDETLSLLQKRLGCKVEQGSDPAITPMRIGIDYMGIQLRPLSFYVLISSLNWVLRHFYRSLYSVQYASFGGIEYLLRMPTQWDPETSPRPIVFLHGLGVGLLQYHPLIAHFFSEFSDRPVLVPLQPHSSHDFFHPDFLSPPSRKVMSQRLANLIKVLGWARLDNKKPENVGLTEDKEVKAILIGKSQRGVTMVSHSNGTYVHAWMLKEYPDIIGRSCFIDPVTFCSWEGDICYNFFYRPCMTGMQLVMRYFVASELGICNLLMKHYCWTSNSLWFEEIPYATDPTKTLFLLGGKDDILNAERVKQYLTSHGVRKNLWYDPEGKHGAALMKGGRGHEEVMRWLSQYED